MTKEEFIEWLGVAPDKKGLVEVVLEGIIDEAISDHEQAKWKKYPDEKPAEKQNCLIIWKDGDVKAWQYYRMVYEIWDANIKYWQPMPEQKLWTKAEEYRSDTIQSILDELPEPKTE